MCSLQLRIDSSFQTDDGALVTSPKRP